MTHTTVTVDKRKKIVEVEVKLEVKIEVNPIVCSDYLSLDKKPPQN